MKITREVSLFDFEAWSGAKDTLEVLYSNECEIIESCIEDLFPQGMTETELNDFLWFERDTIAEWLCYENWDALEEAHENEESEV